VVDDKIVAGNEKEIDLIFSALKNEDPLGVVIRGHLYVESQLIQLLEEALPDPGAIDLTRLNFPTKLDLAVALKVIKETEKRGYAGLNSLRNHLAHNIDVELRESDEKRLYQALSESQKEAASKLSKEISGWKLLRACVGALCAESLSQRLIVMRAKQK
jgi:hypothetical protein